MAADKKSSYISKGERRNVNTDCMKAHKIAYRQSLECLLNKMAAYRKNKKVFVTIPNPNDKETNKRFIRVPASEAWN